MVRKYQRSAGSRKYKDYTEDTLESAVEAVQNGLSLRKASEKFGISRCALSAAVKGKPQKVGRPFVFSREEEEKLAECVRVAGDWGFPLTVFDIRLIVKSYLDRSGRDEPRFKNNMPGADFIEGFMKRHNGTLSNRLCQNIKRSRAAVSSEIINEFFDELSVSLANVDPCMIVNYDETNLTDDPGRKKVVVRRGTRHPERILDFSKSSTSVMFAGSADGTLLPPYITFKAANLYDTWTENGPKGAVYNRSKSGWFTLEIFEDWFRKIAIPYFRKFDNEATKVLIGDNLASHISQHIIQECKNHNIMFVLLPPNSTHYTQPLDVAFFGPLKRKWREVLNDWKCKTRGTVPKDKFPRLLSKCISDLGEETIKNNLKMGFKAAGIVPLDRQAVLKRLPSGKIMDENLDSSNNWVESFQNFLEESRKKETQPLKIRKKKKLNVPAGRGIESLESLEAEGCSFEPDASTQRKGRKTMRPQSESSDDSEEFSVQDSDSDIILSDSSDDNLPVPAEILTEETAVVPKKTEVQMNDLKPDVCVIVTLIFNKNTKHQIPKMFYAVILETNPEEEKVKVKFFRRSIKSLGNDYVFPNVDDEMDVHISNIDSIVQPLKVRRGRYTFPYALKE